MACCSSHVDAIFLLSDSPLDGLAHELLFEQLVPEGYAIKGDVTLQSAFFSHFGSMYRYNECNEKEYPRIAYGKPYSAVITPALRSSPSYLFLMVFTQSKSIRLRNTFRRRTLQWRKAYNTSYLFAMTEDDPAKMRKLERESAYHHDLLVFNHANTYHNLALTVLLTYHFVNQRSVSSAFYAKLDDDVALHLPLLYRVLHSKEVTSRRQFYGGDCMRSYYNYLNPFIKNYVPKCLIGEDIWIPSYARGGFYVFSSNLLSSILIGARHLPFIAHNEDANTGKALMMVNVMCYPLREGYWLARFGCMSKEECRQFVSIHPKYSMREVSGYYDYLQKCLCLLFLSERSRSFLFCEGCSLQFLHRKHVSIPAQKTRFNSYTESTHSNNPFLSSS